jgi:hypothetical protein
MEITTRSLWTLIHGMGFGALYLLASSGAIVRSFDAIQPNLHHRIRQAEIASSASI